MMDVMVNKVLHVLLNLFHPKHKTKQNLTMFIEEKTNLFIQSSQLNVLRELVEYWIVILVLFDHKPSNEHHVDQNKSINDVQSQNPLFNNRSNLFRDIQIEQTM